MKTIIFAPETINLAETSRMVVIADACRGKFDALFTSYGGELLVGLLLHYFVGEERHQG